MVKIFKQANIFCVSLSLICISANVQAEEQNYQEISIVSELGLENEALYFPAKKTRPEETTIAILLHQSSAHKESWIEFAQRLQAHGISALSLEDTGRRDVLSALAYLKNQGFGKFALVGASIGGGASLQAINSSPENIDKVVLLSTSSGSAITNPDIDKLLITSKTDMWGKDSYEVYAESSDPKELIELEGHAHGQDILKDKGAELITVRIIDFLLN